MSIWISSSCRNIDREAGDAEPRCYRRRRRRVEGSDRDGRRHFASDARRWVPAKWTDETIDRNPSPTSLQWARARFRWYENLTGATPGFYGQPVCYGLIWNSSLCRWPRIKSCHSTDISWWHSRSNEINERLCLWNIGLHDLCMGNRRDESPTQQAKWWSAIRRVNNCPLRRMVDKVLWYENKKWPTRKLMSWPDNNFHEAVVAKELCWVAL